jgi:hypothetical protein
MLKIKGKLNVYPQHGGLETIPVMGSMGVNTSFLMAPLLASFVTAQNGEEKFPLEVSLRVPTSSLFSRPLSLISTPSMLFVNCTTSLLPLSQALQVIWRGEGLPTA